MGLWISVRSGAVLYALLVELESLHFPLVKLFSDYPRSLTLEAILMPHMTGYTYPVTPC